MVEALRHFLWPDSRDPVAGVAYEAPKVSGQPAPVIVEIGAGVHVSELTIKTSHPRQKRDCQQRRRPLESLLELGNRVAKEQVHGLPFLGTFRRYWLRSPESESCFQKERQQNIHLRKGDCDDPAFNVQTSPNRPPSFLQRRGNHTTPILGLHVARCRHHEAKCRMVDDSRTERVECRLFSTGASPVRRVDNVAVSAQATFGRDGAMFDSFVGFIAQLSLVLWVLVVLTMIVRIVGIRIYRDSTRATPARIAAVRSPQVQSPTARTDAGRNAPLGEALQPIKRQTEVAGTTVSGLAMHKVHLENRSAEQVRGLAANSTGA